MRKLVLATGNKGKLKELTRILADTGFELMSLSDYPPMVEPDENADNFAGNASIKALAVAEHTGELAIADDSGLVIDALDGAPGVFSSRFAGEGASDEDRNTKVLNLMKDVPAEKRTARFVCVAAIAEPGKVIGTAEGKCEGHIISEPRGTHGFGYDPIFLVDGFDATMAELPMEIKNEISHRAKAVNAAKEILKKLV